MKTTFDELDAGGASGANRWISSALWKHLPLEPVTDRWDRRGGVAMVDDFTDFNGALSTNDGQYYSEGNTYYAYQTASTFIVPVALSGTPASVLPASVGAIALYGATGITDNDIMGMLWGGQKAAPYGSFPFAVIPGISGDLAFEARFKVSSVAASIGDLFIGLAGAAGVQMLTATSPIADADTLVTTHSLLGFSRLAAETTQLYLTYERASGTVARTLNMTTLVADTYIKAGFFYNGAQQTLTPYIDGAAVAAAYRIGRATANATPWPNDYMAPMICAKQIDGDTKQTVTLDWWACAQLPPIKGQS